MIHRPVLAIHFSSAGRMEVIGGDVSPLCLICGQDLTEDLEWSEEQKGVYRYFEKWMEKHHPQSTKKKRKSSPGTSSSLGWREGEERCPICGECQAELKPLADLQRQIESLERKIQGGMETLKKKMRRGEEILEGRGVYERDKRYGRVRGRILKLKLGNVTKSAKSPRIATAPVKKTVSNRKSCRRKKVTADEDPCVVISPLPLEAPERDPLECNDNEEHFGDWEDDLDVKPDIDRLIEEELSLSSPTIKTEKEEYVTSRGRCRRPRRSVKVICEESEDEKAAPRKRIYRDDSDDGDSDFTPDVIEPPKPKRKKRDSQRSKRGQPRKRQLSPSERDPDWSMDMDNDNDNAEHDGGDDDDDIDSDPNVNEETGKRKNHCIKKDPATGVVTYAKLTFHPVDPPPESPSAPSLQCSDCLELVEFSYYHINSHYVRSHRPKYQCPQCPRQLRNPHGLKVHLKRSHEGDKSFGKGPPKECNICGKPVSRTRYKAHLWSHKSPDEKQKAMETGDPSVPGEFKKLHICEECGASFKNLGGLKSHKIIHLEKEERVQLCPECGGSYLDLRSHRKREHGVGGSTVRICIEPGCGKTFKNTSSLNCHKNAVHRKIRPWKCPECPRDFANQGTWKIHVNLHKGIRPWKCDECGMSFGSKGNLKKHVNSFHVPGSNPRRKPYIRGVTALGCDVRKKELVEQGKYLPPSALATWAQGREPTSHFPQGYVAGHSEKMEKEEDWNSNTSNL